MEVCRACLSSHKNMMPLNETFINGYNLLTNLNIKPLDGMPQSACKTCVNAVNYFIDFREQCIQSETSLQQKMLENIKLEREECTDNQTNEDIPKLSDEKYDPEPKKESLPKRRRGRPRKDITASETHKARRGRPRKNKTHIPQMKETVNPLLESEIYSNSKELLSSQNESYDLELDIVKEEIKYEYIEEESIIDNDNSLHLDRNLKGHVDRNTPENLGIEENLLEQSKTKKKSKILVMNETDFPCGLCEKRFETQQCVSTHLENHKSDTKCETCHATFPEWPGLLAHRVEHIPGKYHQCHMCHGRLYSMETLEYHYLSKHLNKSDIKLSCKLCAKAFPTPVKLKRHVATHTTKKEYVCDHCSQAFRTKCTLKVHMTRHNEDKQYVCIICGYSCRQHRNLKDHILRKHTTTRVYCKGCKRVFPDQEGLQQHACSQSEKICFVCGKVYKRLDRLKSHMESHSDVRKYKCELCPATFKTRYCFVAHTNRHKGDRAYACPHCPKRFYAAQHLTKHKRIHTGVRPYACKVCSKAFNTNYNLKIHMRVHGEYLVAHRNKQSDNPINT